MLVLSRKIGEQIVLPGLGITLSVEQVCGGRVAIGILAPRHIPILRGELISKPFVNETATFGDPKLMRDQEPRKFSVLFATRPSLTRDECTSALTKRNLHVHTADDGVKCLELLNQSLPDVLVIEPELPLGGGDGVLEIVHESLELQRVPVLALTKEQNRSAIYRISRFAISDFAVQPVTADQLADRVERLAVQRRVESG